MTSRERIPMALRHEKSDRIPIQSAHQRMIAVEPIFELGVRLQQIGEQVAWLQARVRQLTMMRGPGNGSAPAQAPTTWEAPEKSDLQLYVDQGCRGCGLCVRIAPRTFRMDPQTGQASALPDPGDPPSAIQMAVARCPVGAIHYG